MSNRTKGDVPVAIINGSLFAARDTKQVRNKVETLKERCSTVPSINKGMVQELVEAEGHLNEAAKKLDSFFQQVTQQF